MQQSYARVPVTEPIHLADLVEDALRLNAAAFARKGILIERDFAQVPPATLDKHKVLQILVNLFRNAKHAIDSASRPDKRIAIRIGMNERERIEITIHDNGIGIPCENLTKIFTRGFTTKKDGHGFGLHSGALAAEEMGGSLRGYSEGEGKGATFILELPLHSPKPKSGRTNAV